MRRTIIDLWSSWCIPCKAMEPLLDKLEKEYEGKIEVQRINTDQRPGEALYYGVRGVPTLIFYLDGKEQKRTVGAKSYKELKEILNEIYNL